MSQTNTKQAGEQMYKNIRETSPKKLIQPKKRIRETSPTPGPWHVSYGTDQIGIYPDSSNRTNPKCIAVTTDRRSMEENTANACLIAAAPLMYEAIRDTLDLAQPGLPLHIVKQLSAALNAADGGK